MKVILSVEPVRFPLTGIGRYTYELAQRLLKSPEVSDLQFFAGRRFLPGLPNAAEASGTGYGLKRAIQKNFLGIEAYRLLMPLLKARALSGHVDYLYHSPNYYLPPFKGPKVATFHDLSPFTWAHCHAPQMARYLQKELRVTLKRADRLITDSEFTRRELAEYFSWPIERIDTVALASSPDFYPVRRLSWSRYWRAMVCAIRVIRCSSVPSSRARISRPCWTPTSGWRWTFVRAGR